MHAFLFLHRLLNNETALGLVVSASASMLVGLEFDSLGRVLPTYCKFAVSAWARAV